MVNYFDWMNKENSQTLQFSEQVDKALNELLPTSDPFDQPHFDPIQFINEKFPTEESLSELDNYLIRLKKNITTMDEEIINTVRKQSMTGNQAEKDLIEAKIAIKGLFEKIKEIKKKAEQSEGMVVEITRDIKALDYGKKNISNTINAITKLQLMENVIEQLKNLSEKQIYTKVSDLLKVIQDLEIFFKPYFDIPKIKENFLLYENIKINFKKSLIQDFKNLDENQTFRKDNLNSACLLVDSLGESFRKEIIQNYCKQQMDYYKEKYPALKGDLENVINRFTFLRNKLNEMKNQFGDSIPSYWNLPQELTVEYFLCTRELFLKMLKDINASTLYRSLKDTIRFENEMTTRFSSTKNYNYVGLLSKCYEDYMGVYLEDQDQKMGQTLDDLIKEEKWSFQGDSSSESLFIFLNSSFTNVITINKGKTMIQLIQIWKKHIQRYSQILSDQLTKPQKESTSFDFTSLFLGNQALKYKLSPKEELTHCYIVKISDYCKTNLEGLKDELTQKVDQEYQDKIEFQKEREKFIQVFNNSIQLLVLNIINQLQEDFDNLLKIQWSNIKQVDEESEYVRSMITKINTSLSGLKLSDSHYTNLCEKLIVSFFNAFMNYIKKIKRISTDGATQLLFDNTSFFNYFSKILKETDEENVNRFLKVLKQQSAKPVSFLKVINCPIENIVDVYHSQYSDPKKKSVEDFLLILEMKGISKNDQQTLLNKFKNHNNVELLK